ncbi:MAG: hypothetical protein ACXWU7_04995 [Telluria sp.]
MKRMEQSVLLAGVLALGLAACTTDKMGGETATTAQINDNTYGTPTTGAISGNTADTSQAAAMPDTPPTQPTPPAESTAAAADPMAAVTSQATADTRAPAPNSVVTMIEVVPRPAAAGAVGATGAAGATGSSSSSSDRLYRVTLRMDDGSTQVITQEWAPTFRSGDRVQLMGGEIQRR